MGNKDYKLSIYSRGARPRSPRLRELGGTISVGTSNSAGADSGVLATLSALSKILDWFEEDSNGNIKTKPMADGTERGFYSVSFIASGRPVDSTPDSGGSGTGGISSLTVNLGDISYRGVGTTDVVVNLPAYPTTLPASDVYAWAKQPTKPSYVWSEIGSKPTWIGANKPSYAFSEIGGKPTTLAGYGITDGVNAVSVTGSGNVVTAASVSGHVLTLTKGVNALTSVSLATISDLHSSWDAVLKAQKPTTLAGYGITDAYTKQTVDDKIAALQSVINAINSWFTLSDGTLITTYNIAADGQVSAGGQSSGGGGSAGGLIQTVYRYTQLNITLSDNDKTNTFNAYTIQQLANRIESLESTPSGISSLTINLGTVSYKGVGTTDVVVNLPAYYSVADSDNRYLQLSGGTMNGDITMTGHALVWDDQTAYDDVPTGLMGVSIVNDSELGYSTCISFKNYYGLQIAAHGAANNFHIRGYNHAQWNSWYELLHSGNIGSFALTPSNYTSTLDSRYVKKSGDTMTGALTVPSLAVSGSTATVSGNKVWHSGNDGSGSGLDADLLDGHHGNDYLLRSGGTMTGNITMSNGLAIEWEAGLAEDYNMSRASGLRIDYAAGSTANTPTSSDYGSVLSVLPYYYGFQIAQSTSSGTINWRFQGHYNTTSWSTWKTIVDSDNIGSYNAGSATKLQTARTLWGRPFDGTAPVSGDMTGVGSITAAGTGTFGGTLLTPEVMVFNSMSTADYRLNFNWSGELARIYAVANDGSTPKDLILGSTNASRGLYYDASTGYWGVGTASPAMKLHVAGETRFDGWMYSYNAVGWYNVTYGGGIYMTDSTYVRVYNGKAFYVANNIVATGEVSAGNASDRRLKSNISTLSEGETAHVLSHLNPVAFTWNAKAEELSGGDKKGIARSFVADEFLSLLPNAGRKMWDEYDAIYTEQAVPYLVKGWQMHERRLSDHERRIQELERENRELKRQLRRVA